VLLRGIVEELGARVATAERPSLALRALVAEPPELLITDLRMPEMSGVELVRLARSRDPLLCCLIITGFATEEVAAQAFAAGAQDLLLKPVVISEVQARIRHAVESMRLRREVLVLRAALAEQSRTAAEPPGVARAERARELAGLPALPGGARPLQPPGRGDALSQLERLATLLREGALSPVEFEDKKRGLLQRI
jgi:DNA-binding NtrC family response regulator